MTNGVTDAVINKLIDREKQVLQLLIEEPGYTIPQMAKKIFDSMRAFETAC